MLTQKEKTKKEENVMSEKKQEQWVNRNIEMPFKLY